MRAFRGWVIAIVSVASSLACEGATASLGWFQPAALSSPTAAFTPPAFIAPRDAKSACPDKIQGVLEAGEQQAIPTSHFPQVDTSDSLFVSLVTYTITGDEIGAPSLEQVPQELLNYQQDFATQAAAWSLFSRLVPSEQRSMLTEFQIMTDGPGDVLSAVEQGSQDPRGWVLEVDIADAGDPDALAFTLLHEFGHLMTLNPAQVPPDDLIFRSPHSSRVRDSAMEACPGYFPGEGCSLPDSYLNRFYDRFWKGIDAEWQRIDRINDDEWRYEKLRSFYRKRSDQFVDVYAVSSPTEDIAETWTYYVLQPPPTGASIMDQKLQFFYEYPELVQLREQIRGNLCVVHP